MKKLLLVLLLLVSFNSFAQITLEHSYDNGAVTRIKLEYSGEKYYELKRETNELIFYNSDHTFWKTIVLPASLPNSLNSPSKVYHVSEAKINPDANIEIILAYYIHSSKSSECKIISENGTTLLTIPDNAKTHLDEKPGLFDKVFISDNVSSKVYSVPGLILENTYAAENVRRIKLENSGEKYYLTDKVNNKVNIYNSNHSLWKTVSLPKPTNATYTDIDFISETQINPDGLLEIGYTYSEKVGYETSYSSKIVNENSVELLSVPNSIQLQISSIEGFQDKLMAEILINNYEYSSNIYNLPSLSLEKAYESKVSRVKLENSGEKYYTSNRPLNNQVKIYNSNHTLWKTIDHPIPVGFGFLTINNISETKINKDALIELLYTCQTGLLAFGYEYSSKVINENGDILFSTEGIQDLTFSEILGLQNKLIGYVFPYTHAYASKVYSLGNLSTSDFNKNSKVLIAPNPAKSFININSFSVPIIEATVYNMNGALVKKENAQNITKIAVDKLPKGIYIVNLTDFNNQKSTHKITIVH